MRRPALGVLRVLRMTAGSGVRGGRRDGDRRDRGTKRGSVAMPGDEDEVDARCGVHPAGAPGNSALVRRGRRVRGPARGTLDVVVALRPTREHPRRVSKQIDAYVRAEFYPNDKKATRRRMEEEDQAGGPGRRGEPRGSRASRPGRAGQVTTPDNRGTAGARVRRRGLSPPTPNRPYVPGRPRTTPPPCPTRSERAAGGTGRRGRPVADRQVLPGGQQPGAARCGPVRGAFVDLSSGSTFRRTRVGPRPTRPTWAFRRLQAQVRAGERWSRTPLTDAQVRYAAQDACLSCGHGALFAIYAARNLATGGRLPGARRGKTSRRVARSPASSTARCVRTCARLGGGGTRRATRIT